MSNMKSLRFCLTRSYPLTRSVIQIKYPHITRQNYDKQIHIGAGISRSSGHRKCKTIAAHLKTKVKHTNQSNVFNGRHSSKGNSIGFLTRKNKLKHAHHSMKLTRNLSTNTTESRTNPNAAPDTNSARNNLSGSANSIASFVHTKLPTSESNKNKTSTNESDNCLMPSFGEFLSGEYSRYPLVRKGSLIPVPADFQLPSFAFLSKESKGCGKLKHAHHCMKLTRNLSTNTTEKRLNPNATPDTNSTNIMASFVHSKLPTAESNQNKTTNEWEHNCLTPSFGEFLSGECSCDPLIRKDSVIPVLADFRHPSFAFLSKESKGCGIFQFNSKETVSAAKNHKEPAPCEDDCLNKISELTELDSKPVLCQNFNHSGANFVEKINCDRDLVILNKDGLKCSMAPIIAKDEDIEQNNTSSDLKSDISPSPVSINTEVLKNFRNEMEILGNTPSDCVWKNLEVVADIKGGNDISDPVNVKVSIIPSKCTENKDSGDDLTKIKPEKIPYRSPHSNSISSIINSVDKSAVIIQKDLYVTNHISNSLEKKKEEDKKSNQPKIELISKLDFDNAFEFDLCHKVRPQECGLPDNIIVSKTIIKPNKTLNSFKNYLSATVLTNFNNKCPEIQKRETHSKSSATKPPDQTNPTVNTTTKTVITSTKLENRTEISVQEVQKFVDKRIPFPFCTETVFQVVGSNEKLGEAANVIESVKAKLATINSENSKNSLASQHSFKNMLSTIKSGYKKSEDKSVVIPTEDVNSEPHSTIQSSNINRTNSVMSPEEFAKKTKHAELMRLARAINANNAKIKTTSNRLQYDKPSKRLPVKRPNLGFKKGSIRRSGTDSVRRPFRRPFRESNERIKLMTPKQIDAILGIKPKSGNENEKLKLQIRAVDKDNKSNKVVIKPRKPVDNSTEIKQGSTAKPVKDDKRFIKKEESKPIMKLLPAKITDVKDDNKTKTDTMSKSNDNTKLDDKDDSLSARDRQILKELLVSRKNERQKPSNPNSSSSKASDANRELHKSYTPENNKKQLFSPIVKPPKSEEAIKTEIRVIKGEKELKKEDAEKIIKVIRKPVDNSTEIKQGSAAKPVKDDKWFVKKEESKPIMKLLPAKITDVKDNKIKTDTMSMSNDNTKLDDKDESLSARDRQILKQLLVSRKNERQKPLNPNSSSSKASGANRELHKSYTPENNEKQLFSPIVKPPKSEGAIRTEVRIIKGEKELKKEKEDAEKIIKLIKAVQNKTIAEDKLDPKLKLSKATIDTERIVELFKAKIDSYGKSAKGETEVPKKSSEDFKADTKTDTRPGNPKMETPKKSTEDIKADTKTDIRPGNPKMETSKKSTEDIKADTKTDTRPGNPKLEVSKKSIEDIKADTKTDIRPGNPKMETSKKSTEDIKADTKTDTRSGNPKLEVSKKSIEDIKADTKTDIRPGNPKMEVSKKTTEDIKANTKTNIRPGNPKMEVPKKSTEDIKANTKTNIRPGNPQANITESIKINNGKSDPNLNVEIQLTLQNKSAVDSKTDPKMEVPKKSTEDIKANTKTDIRPGNPKMEVPKKSTEDIKANTKTDIRPGNPQANIAESIKIDNVKSDPNLNIEIQLTSQNKSAVDSKTDPKMEVPKNSTEDIKANTKTNIRPGNPQANITESIKINNGKSDPNLNIEIQLTSQNKSAVDSKTDPKMEVPKKSTEDIKANTKTDIRPGNPKMEVSKKSTEDIKANTKTDIRPGNPQANIAESIKINNMKSDPNLNIEIQLTSQNKSAVDSKTDPKMEVPKKSTEDIKANTKTDIRPGNPQANIAESTKINNMKSDPNLNIEIQLTSQNKSAVDSKTDPKMEDPKKSTEDIKANTKTDIRPGNPQANIAESIKINNLKSDPNLNIEIQLTSQNKSAVDSKTDPKMEEKSENFQGKSRGSDEGKSVKLDPNVKVEIQLTSQNKSAADSKADPKLDLKSKDSQKKNTGSFTGKNLESDPNFDIANAKTEKPIPDINIVTKESTDTKMTLKELKKEKQEALKMVKLLKEFTKISAVKDKLDTANNVKESVKEVTKSSAVKDKLDTKNYVKEPVKELTKNSAVKDKLDTKNYVKESVKDLTKSSAAKDKLDTTNNAKEPVKSSPAPKPTPGDKPHVVTKSERLTAILPKPLEVTRNKVKSQISESEGQAKPEPKIITRNLIEKIKKAPMESPIFTAANSITESEKELSRKIDKSLFQSKSSKQIELIDDFYLGKLDTSMRHPEVLLLKAKKSFAEVKKQASKIGNNDEKYSPSLPQTKSRGNLASIPKQSVHTLNPRKVDIPEPPTSTQGSTKAGKQISPTVVTSEVPLPASHNTTEINKVESKPGLTDLAMSKINLESSKPIHNQPEIKPYKPALKEELAMSKIQLESSKPFQINKGKLKDYKLALKEELATSKIQLESSKPFQINEGKLKAYKPAFKEDLVMSKIQLESSKPFQINKGKLKAYKPAFKEDLAMSKIQLESSKPFPINEVKLKDYKLAFKEDLAMSKIQLESSKPFPINEAKFKDYKLAIKEDLAMSKIQLDSPKPIQIKGAELKDYKPDFKEDLGVNEIQFESSKPIQINGADLKPYTKPTFKESNFFSETRKTCLINGPKSNFEFKEDLALSKFKEYISALKNSKITATYVLPRSATQSVKTKSSTILPSLQPIKSSISPSLGKLDKTAEIQKKITDRNRDLMATCAEQEISKMEVEGYYNQDHSQSSSALHHFEVTQQRLDDDLKRMQQKLSKFETEGSMNLLKDSLSKMTIDDKGIETSSKQNKIDVNKENKKRSLSVDNLRRAADEKKIKEDKRDALDRTIKERILNKMDLKPLTRKSESEKHLIKTNSSDKNFELISDSPPISSLLSLEDELLKTKVKELFPPLKASPSTAKSQLPQRDFMMDFDKVGKESNPPLDIRMCKICPTPERRILSFPMNNVKKKQAVHNPIAGVLSIDPNKNIMLKKALKTLPSVTNILNATMCENSKLQLTKWRSSIISQLGEDGFKKFYSEQLQKGNEFHASIHSFLKKFKEPGKDVNHYTNQCFKSIKDVLKNISEVSVVESLVVHPLLAYRGVIDCVAKYKNKNVLIEWKRSDKSKPTMRHTFDAPLQLSAYIGALSFDPAYDMQVEGALIVVAYSDGTPADVFNISLEECESFWKKWLLRYKNFFANHQGFPFGDVK